jgi:hypothetical protein
MIIFLTMWDFIAVQIKNGDEAEKPFLRLA